MLFRSFVCLEIGLKWQKRAFGGGREGEGDNIQLNTVKPVGQEKDNGNSVKG